MRRQAVRRPERHDLVEIAHPLRAIRRLARQADGGDGAILAVVRGPFDRRVLDRLGLGIGPELHLELEHHVRRVSEAVLVLMRIEQPVLQLILMNRRRKRRELGDMIAVAQRRLAEIAVVERVAEGMAEEIRLGARRADHRQHLVEVARHARHRALHAFGHAGRFADQGAVAQEPRRRARGESRTGREHEVLRIDVVAGQFLTLRAEHLDRHAAMGGDAVAERFARTLREADCDFERAAVREQALCQLGRQVVGDGQLADYAGRALGMTGADRMALALLDGLALLGHPLDDAVDRLLLVGLRLLDIGRVAEICHEWTSRTGVDS